MRFWRLYWGNGSVMIVYASCLHLLWATVLMIAGPTLTTATPIASLLVVSRGHRLLIAWLVGAAAAALWAAHEGPSWYGFVAMLPQQFLLLVSAIGGLGAVLLGRYADLVIRPWPFILTDQAPIILAAPLYTLAVFVYHGVELRPVREPRPSER